MSDEQKTFKVGDRVRFTKKRDGVETPVPIGAKGVVIDHGNRDILPYHAQVEFDVASVGYSYEWFYDDELTLLIDDPR